MSEKVVLAYSGGLDTTVIIPWLKENYDCEVIAVCVELGLGSETEGLEARALKSGASRFYLEQAQEEFVTEYVYPCLKAGAKYEGHYLLGTSMARPLIAKRLVAIAEKEGATTICHGATGKGNDQVRFELSIKALAPDMTIIAPWRVWNIRSREDVIDYLAERNIEVPFKKETSYSRDRNLWHLSHEGLELESPANSPDYDHLLQLSVSPFKAPDTPERVELTFEKGLPTHLNGKALGPVDMVDTLNQIGGRHGIGIVDLVENRVVGLKARGVYETPGGAILYAAHDALEQLCLDRQTNQYKRQVALKYAELVYTGEWFTPLREALDGFVEATQQTITGTVAFQLYKGNLIPAGMSSPYSLYDEELASFTTGELYHHQDAQGFITLFGLPLKVRAKMMARAKAQFASQLEAQVEAE
ncbi:MAG: argininosuccinate synthase [Candidatus Melainabacteria bacterium]